MAVNRSRSARAARKRKRRMDRVEHDLTDDQWTALKAAWGGCAYCGAADGPLQRDCVLPISRGGRYTADNVVPACRSCNAGKCNAEVTGWLRRKRLDERAFLERHVAIRTALGLHAPLSQTPDSPEPHLPEPDPLDAEPPNADEVDADGAEADGVDAHPAGAGRVGADPVRSDPVASA